MSGPQFGSILLKPRLVTMNSIADDHFNSDKVSNIFESKMDQTVSASL